jgi:HSP20 family protein
MNESKESSQVQSCSTALAAVEPKAVHPSRPYHTSRYDQEAWEVSVRLPGARKEDVTASIENEVLEVNAVTRFDVPEGWRPLGRYENERHWRLRLDVGPEVDHTRISGSLEDGVLTLRLPLREEVKPRSIEIR